VRVRPHRRNQYSTNTACRLDASSTPPDKRHLTGSRLTTVRKSAMYPAPFPREVRNSPVHFPPLRGAVAGPVRLLADVSGLVPCSAAGLEEIQYGFRYMRSISTCLWAAGAAFPPSICVGHGRLSATDTDTSRWTLVPVSRVSRASPPAVHKPAWRMDSCPSLSAVRRASGTVAR
jgi:hypothetical protein